MLVKVWMVALHDLCTGRSAISEAGMPRSVSAGAMPVPKSQHCLCLHAAVLHGQFKAPAANFSAPAAGPMGTGQMRNMALPRRDIRLHLHMSQCKEKGAYLLCCIEWMACSHCTAWGTVWCSGSSRRSLPQCSECANPCQASICGQRCLSLPPRGRWHRLSHCCTAVHLHTAVNLHRAACFAPAEALHLHVQVMARLPQPLTSLPLRLLYRQLLGLSGQPL